MDKNQPAAAWPAIVKENHCGYNPLADYETLVRENPITAADLAYFESVIVTGANGGQADYDSFTDEGGIDIAAALLAEVRRLRERALATGRAALSLMETDEQLIEDDRGVGRSLAELEAAGQLPEEITSMRAFIAELEAGAPR